MELFGEKATVIFLFIDSFLLLCADKENKYG